MLRPSRWGSAGAWFAEGEPGRDRDTRASGLRRGSLYPHLTAAQKVDSYMTWAFGGSRAERSVWSTRCQSGEPSTSELSRLAVAAGEGDAAAYESLVRRVNQLVSRYCRSRLGSSPGGIHTADDAAQEACLSLLEILPTYRPQDGPFEALMYTVASRRVADQQRSAYRVPIPMGEIPEEEALLPTPEERVLAADEAARVRRLMQELSTVHREVLTLRVAVGMSADEVAAALDMTPGAVRVAQHRALNRLRAMLAADQKKESVDA